MRLPRSAHLLVILAKLDLLILDHINIFITVHACRKRAHGEKAATLSIMQPLWTLLFICVWAFMRLRSIVLFISSALVLPRQVGRIIILNLAHESPMQPCETSQHRLFFALRLCRGSSYGQDFNNALLSMLCLFFSVG